MILILETRLVPFCKNNQSLCDLYLKKKLEIYACFSLSQKEKKKYIYTYSIFFFLALQDINGSTISANCILSEGNVEIGLNNIIY
jgi:hypothetical protein